MMRLMIKRSMGLMMILAISLSAFACKDNTTTTTTTSAAANAVTPALSNPDDVFFQGDGYAVTYGDVFEEFKINDGINQLMFMVDEVLLANYIAGATAEEITEKAKYLTYGTADDAEIAALEPDVLADYEASYAENMFLLGYSGNEEAYVRMIIAKEKYANDAMVDETNNKETWYVGNSTVASYYENYYFADVTAIKIRCYNEEDAKQVMKAFNLISYHGDLRLYTGTVALDQVPTSSLDDTNTRGLTDAELLTYFIQMYNYVYGAYRTEISEDATIADLQALEDLKVSYADLKTTHAGLATFLFSTLSDYESYLADETADPCYTYAPAKYYGTADTACYLILKIDGTEKVDLSDYDPATDGDLADLIGQALYDELSQKMIEANNETSGFVSQVVASLRTDHGFDILDYYLGVDYSMIDAKFKPTTTGDASVIATYDDVSITSDQLFTYALDKNGALYSLYAAQMAVAMDTYFARVYCVGAETCDLDLTTNTSEKIADHEAALAALKTSFAESYYSYYYTFAEYLYLAYGAKSDEDMIRKYYVKSTLQPYLIYDELISDDWALLSDYLYDLIQDYYDNYFSLDVTTLVIYVDRNEDGNLDDYPEFVAGLSDPVAYDLLIGDFEIAIRNYLAAPGNTFDTLIKAFNRALRTDATWGVYKQYGFYLSKEDLSSEASLTYLTSSGTYEDVLIEGFIAAYAEYSLPENASKSSIYYSQSIETATGVALLYCEKGSDFVKPSAAFAEAIPARPAYSVGVENADDLPSLSQLKLYCTYRFYEIVYGTGEDVEATYDITVPVLPTSLMTAMEAYFTELHDSIYVVGFLNIIVADQLQTGTYTNTHPAYCSTGDAALKTHLLAIKDIYFHQVFADYDTLE